MKYGLACSRFLCSVDIEFEFEIISTSLIEFLGSTK